MHSLAMPAGIRIGFVDPRSSAPQDVLLSFAFGRPRARWATSKREARR
jgi:hypothetical protein